MHTIPVTNMHLLTSDKTGNAYISNGNEIILINRSDSIFKRNSFIKYGELTSIDASNPMKVLLFYMDQNRLSFVDNTLSDFNQSYRLDELNGAQITLACASYDNGFWLYNPSEFSLERYTALGTVTNNMKSIHQIVNVPEIAPNFLLENSRNIYLNDPKIGIMVFDIFGGFSKIIPIKDIISFQIIEQNLVYQRANDAHIYNFHLLNFKEEILAIQNAPQESILRFSIQLKKLYLLTEKGLYIYGKD